MPRYFDNTLTETGDPNDTYLLRDGEDFGQWRIRVWQPSSLRIYVFRPICPAHF